MGLRKGVYVGFWCPETHKKALQKKAASEHRTLSQELNRIVEEVVKTLPPEQKGERSVSEAGRVG